MKVQALGVFTILWMVTQLMCVGGQSLDLNNNSSLRVKSRGKRYLDFTKGTRMSWRTTVKNNILLVNTLWAYGFGFRANFPFPDKSERRRPFFKRDVFHGITDVLNAHGFDGQACMLKSFCTAHVMPNDELATGMLFKVLKLLFTFAVAAALILFFTHSQVHAANSNVVPEATPALAPAPAPAPAPPLPASLFVADQASSSSDTEKEITFISVNGNHINVNTTTSKAATTKTNGVNGSNSRDQTLRRSKRYLDFLETSRMIFRVNIKNNIIPKPTIWAHGYGFRCNYPIESNKKVRPFRRDTYEILGDLMDKSGFDGQACILKAYCAAHMNGSRPASKGMLFKLLEYIFTLSDDDRRHFPYLHHRNCQQILHSHCPLSFNNISPYTDDV